MFKRKHVPLLVLSLLLFISVCYFMERALPRIALTPREAADQRDATRPRALSDELLTDSGDRDSAGSRPPSKEKTEEVLLPPKSSQGNGTASASPKEETAQPPSDDRRKKEEAQGSMRDSSAASASSPSSSSAPASSSKSAALRGAQASALPASAHRADRSFQRGPQNDRQKKVVAMMRHAWNDGYVKYAWGEDELHPLSKKGENGWKLGLTLIDSLDTLYILGMDEEYRRAREWVADKSNLVMQNVGNVNLFETTIRVLGGLLGAHALTEDKIFLERARDLGEHLLPGVRGTGNGVPFSDIEIRSGRGKWGGGDASTAEATTLQLEFKTLSHITGDTKFAKEVDKVTRTIRGMPKKDGLVAILLKPHGAQPMFAGAYSLGARGDSYYEYLLKQWILTNQSEPVFLEDYRVAMRGVREHLVKRTNGPLNLTYIAEETSSGSLYQKMDHLVCFLPGLLAEGAKRGAAGEDSTPAEELELAKVVLRTCYQMYVSTGNMLGPEITHFDMDGKEVLIKPQDSHVLLRPETIESLFYLYRHTGDKKYQDWGWEMLQAFERHARVESGGYCSLDTALGSNPMKRDKMESFFLAETLKYLFLLFDDTREQVPLDTFVFNTEAHPLRIYSPG